MSLSVSRGGACQTGATSSVLPCWTRCLAVRPHPACPVPQGRFPPLSACTRFLASRSSAHTVEVLGGRSATVISAVTDGSITCGSRRVKPPPAHPPKCLGTLAIRTPYAARRSFAPPDGAPQGSAGMPTYPYRPPHPAPPTPRRCPCSRADLPRVFLRAVSVFGYTAARPDSEVLCGPPNTACVSDFRRVRPLLAPIPPAARNLWPNGFNTTS